MLDFMCIFTKGGLVLWCFQNAGADVSTMAINALVQKVILQNVSEPVFHHDRLELKYALDNEFDLVFVVGYQNTIKLSYVDKLLNDTQKLFRERYKDALWARSYGVEFAFNDLFSASLDAAQESAMLQAQAKQMKSYKESEKSKKNIASMMKPDKNDKENHVTFSPAAPAPAPNPGNQNDVEAARARIANKFQKKQPPTSPKPSKPEKRTKEARKWENGGTDSAVLDFSAAAPEEGSGAVGERNTAEDIKLVGTLSGQLPNLSDVLGLKPETKKGGAGMWGMFSSLVGQKVVGADDLEPVLEQLRLHLISKNVASDVATQLSESVKTKVEGKVLGTLDSVKKTVWRALEEACLQMLSPQRRVDILRDAVDAQTNGRPYVIVFCGVNGVGKSTNLAKIAFWLLENGLRVLVAGCDTFRAGAVEQLRTHVRRLQALYPDGKVDLVERGYGKDAAMVAAEAVTRARQAKYDVVLVDTAGRMQDNTPLMVALTKLISINQPDLVLFVGEALVGNEAVDQLVKFSRALADHSGQEKPHLIDGIVLTKFDTIDDKVGAAVSMTYITKQPIVFVGTGQTYKDLANLNAQAVVKALLQ